VYLIDLSIWYTLWSSIVGACAALFQRQGAVRDSFHLREHFMRAPHAFCQRIMPPSSAVGVRNSRGAPSKNDVSQIEASKGAKTIPVKKNIKRGMSSNDISALTDQMESVEDKQNLMVEKVEGSDNRLSEFLDVRTQRWVVFSRVWNEFMNSLRISDHLSNAEKDMYTFSNFEWLTKPIYLPLFQTAGCIEEALNAYIESSLAYANEHKPQKKLLVWEKMQSSMDITTKEAVCEAWELSSWSLNKLVGPLHYEDITLILSLIGKWACSDDLYSKLHSESIPSIIDQISNIIKILKTFSKTTCFWKLCFLTKTSR
jgi:hypothetical protein